MTKGSAILTSKKPFLARPELQLWCAGFRSWWENNTCFWSATSGGLSNYHSEMGTCLWNGRATKFVSFCLESVLSDVFIFLSNYEISDEFYSKKIIFLSNFDFKFVKTQTDWFSLRKVVWVAQSSQVDLQILSQKYRGMSCLVVLVHYNNMIVTINIIPLCNLHDSILWVGTVSHIRQSVVLILHYSANCNGFDIQVLNFNS